jgi:hypothetical protein
MADRISVDAPLDAAFAPVVRLIVGGVAERGAMTFQEMDDLQLAVERLLAEAGADDRAQLSFELGQGRVRARIGPLRERGLADALQMEGGDGAESLSLRRILATVVDSFGVEESVDGTIVIRLEKLVRGMA